MNQIWHDDVSDQIRIASGARSQDYAPQSLVVTMDLGLIAIRLRNSGANVLAADYTQFGDQSGAGFAGPEALVAYLTAEFGKKRAVGNIFDAPSVAGEDIALGMPVTVSRANGALRLARGDTYPLAFVTGLASTNVQQGFAGTPTRGVVTLPDWTQQTGQASLFPGLPYFLAPNGGLSFSPFGPASMAVTQIGISASTQTLVVNPQTPILL